MKCTHLDMIKEVTPSAEGCEECLQTGDWWVHLRLCLTCGHVGCCDSSPNKHATKHAKETGHPIVENNMLFHPNGLFPLLVAGYVGWSQIYEVGPLNEYPIEIKYTNEGEMKLQRLQSGIKEVMAEVNSSTASQKKNLDKLDDQFDIYEKLAVAPKKIEEAIRSTYKYW